MVIYCILIISLLYISTNAQNDQENNNFTYILINEQDNLHHKRNNIKYDVEINRNSKHFNKLFPNNPFFQLQTPDPFQDQTVEPDFAEIEYDHSETEEIYSHPILQQIFQQSTTENISDNDKELEDNDVINPDNPFLQDFITQKVKPKNKITTTEKIISKITETTSPREAIIITTTTKTKTKPQTTSTITTSLPKPLSPENVTTPSATSSATAKHKEVKEPFLSPTIQETITRKKIEKLFPELVKNKPIVNEYDDPEFIALYLSK